MQSRNPKLNRVSGRSRRRGATTVEYALVCAAIIAVAAMLAMSMFDQAGTSVAKIENTLGRESAAEKASDQSRIGPELRVTEGTTGIPVLIAATVGGASALLITAYMVNR